jgi:anti-sigma B factor antagonist
VSCPKLLVSASPEPPRPFKCDVFPANGHVRVVPVGELDLATVPEVRRAVEALRASGVDHLVLDLSGLSFLDSSGIHLLLDLTATARADAHRIELIPGPPEIQRVFALTGTTAALPFRALTAATPRGA